MRKTVVLILLFLSLFFCAALAETEIKAEVDKAKLSTDEGLIYKLIITSSAAKIPLPVLPKFEGFDIVSQAHSSTVSFAGAGAKAMIVYSYILTPQNAGKLKITPSSITIEGLTHTSQEFEIEVTPGKPKPKPRVPPVKPQETPPESEEKQVTL